MREIVDDSFKKEVLDSENLVLVDFFTPDCYPCKLMLPLLNTVSKEKEHIKFVKFNATEGYTADTYNVSSVPTLILFDKGEEVSRIEGLQSIKEIESWIEKCQI